MKQPFICSLIAAAIFLAAACSNPDGPASGKERTDICSILTIGQTEYLDSLEYDKEGRLIKVITFGIEDEEITEIEEVRTYTYSDGRIELTFASEYNAGQKFVFTVGKDNLITKVDIGGDEYGFTYDSEGQLIMSDDIALTWKDGDIISDSTGYTYTYLPTLNPGYCPVSPTATDHWLFQKGYFGKLPKHLISAWGVRNEDTKVAHEFSCEYEVDGGLPVGCNLTAIHTRGNTPSISEYRMTINWKKY